MPCEYEIWQWCRGIRLLGGDAEWRWNVEEGEWVVDLGAEEEGEVLLGG